MKINKDYKTAIILFLALQKRVEDGKLRSVTLQHTDEGKLLLYIVPKSMHNIASRSTSQRIGGFIDGIGNLPDSTATDTHVILRVSDCVRAGKWTGLKNTARKDAQKKTHDRNLLEVTPRALRSVATREARAYCVNRPDNNTLQLLLQAKKIETQQHVFNYDLDAIKTINLATLLFTNDARK